MAPRSIAPMAEDFQSSAMTATVQRRLKPQEHRLPIIQPLDVVAKELHTMNVNQISSSATISGATVTTCMSTNSCSSNISVKSQAITLAHSPFPQACLQLLHSLGGNSHCVDCGAPHPTWASISYGILICLNCSGKHRHFGVNHSIVRSITMDSWDNPSHVLCLLEGGNEQWKSFLRRHKLDTQSKEFSGGKGVYQTKAALFYRENLQRHVKKVLSAGEYKGRHVWREKQNQGTRVRTTARSTSPQIRETYTTPPANDETSCTSDPTNYSHNDTEQPNRL